MIHNYRIESGKFNLQRKKQLSLKNFWDDTNHTMLLQTGVYSAEMKSDNSLLIEEAIC